MLPFVAWISVFVSGSKFASLLSRSHCGVAISYRRPALIVRVGDNLDVVLEVHEVEALPQIYDGEVCKRVGRLVAEQKVREVGGLGKLRDNAVFPAAGRDRWTEARPEREAWTVSRAE